jgi:enoyl-CoA hydratase
VIEREDDGDVAVLRLAHGPVSAMDIELCQAIAEIFEELADDPATAVVLTGTGRSFSAGVDLRRIVDGGPEYVERFLPELSEAFRAVFGLGKPVVAAVNGHAIAGGCVLAACADTVLMADGPGRIGVPEVKVGVAFPRVPLQVMCHAVGEQTARRMVMGAQTYLPADAQALGLVDEVVAPDELLARAVAVARETAAAVPADAFAMTKRQLRRGSFAIMETGADEDAEVEAIWSRRATDGWIADYLAQATGQSRRPAS